MLYWKIYNEINLPFNPTISYNAFQAVFLWSKYKLSNIRYHKVIKILKLKSKIMKRKRTSLYNKYKKLRHTVIFDFLYLYNNFFFNISINLFYFKKTYKLKKKLIFFLIFSFTKNKIFINAQTLKKKNIFFLSPGLYIKFFDKKKSLKKNKNIKLLMAKTLRKIYILTRIKNNILIIKNNPLYFNEMLNYLNLPIVHKFNNPFTDQTIMEKKKIEPIVKILSFVFMKNRDFTKNKYKKVGRIKRKILRKLVIKNNITD